jgi:hypothetical protein
MKRTAYYDDYLYLCYHGMGISDWTDYFKSGGGEVLEKAKSIGYAQVHDELKSSSYKEQTFEQLSFDDLALDKCHDTLLTINIPCLGEFDHQSFLMLNEAMPAFLEGTCLLARLASKQKVDLLVGDPRVIKLLEQWIDELPNGFDIEFNLYLTQESSVFLRNWEIDGLLAGAGCLEVNYSGMSRLILHYLTPLAALRIVRFGAGGFHSRHLRKDEPVKLLQVSCDSNSQFLIEVHCDTSLSVILDKTQELSSNFERKIGLLLNGYLGPAIDESRFLECNLRSDQLRSIYGPFGLGLVHFFDSKFELKKHLVNSLNYIRAKRKFWHQSDIYSLNALEAWFKTNTLLFQGEDEQLYQAQQLAAILLPLLKKNGLSLTHLFAAHTRSCFDHFSELLFSQQDLE